MNNPWEEDVTASEPAPEEELSQLVTQEANAQESAENLWMVPYADLMSTLVILFLALFGYAYLGASTDYERAIQKLKKEMEEKIPLVEPDPQEKETDLAKLLETHFKDERFKDMAKLEMSAQFLNISLSNPVLFDPGEAHLKPALKGLLQPLAQALNERETPVVVEGHTDNVPVRGGRYGSNFELSAARAFSVIEYMIQQGIDPRRLTAYGYGEHQPVAANDTEAGQAQNRRIEIKIKRET